jgi:U3 small nucleolar RNA-associated protein 7
MITLDPEFVGSLAPPSKLTTNIDGKTDIPFARLSRLERLRVQGKADETEDVEGEEDGNEDDSNGKKLSKEEREKRKMRGKGKSMKRYTFGCTHYLLPCSSLIGIYGNNARMSSTLPR